MLISAKPSKFSQLLNLRSSLQSFFLRKIGKQKDKFRGEKCFAFPAPDSITSYILSGVSMNDDHGIGLPEIKPKLTVFLPFFIDAALPHHIKRGEVLMQDILMFNYLKTQSVIITVKRNNKQYEFLDPKLDGWKGEKFFVGSAVNQRATSLQLRRIDFGRT